ncbi:hypothetical protein [Arthrobacter crystallopoietes]|uniref:hypothetical protein n=1 Tax=Crystallibacter crystallopoietes TaxID=37928 RepID=UPI001305188D|nr:hypothetical protein [Arthrobacter crystallopoietes]
MPQHHAGEAFNVSSAGSTPAEHLLPNAAAVMNDLGINMEHEFPKPLTSSSVPQTSW